MIWTNTGLPTEDTWVLQPPSSVQRILSLYKHVKVFCGFFLYSCLLWNQTFLLCNTYFESWNVLLKSFLYQSTQNTRTCFIDKYYSCRSLKIRTTFELAILLCFWIYLFIKIKTPSLFIRYRFVQFLLGVFFKNISQVKHSWYQSLLYTNWFSSFFKVLNGHPSFYRSTVFAFHKGIKENGQHLVCN